jgi:hypothetical protein
MDYPHRGAGGRLHTKAIVKLCLLCLSTALLYIILYFFGMQDGWFSFRTIVCRLICFIEIFLISLPHTTIIDW